MIIFSYLGERVGGVCVKEHTTIYIIDGKKRKKFFSGRSDKNNNYNLTFRHVVEDFVKKGNLK